MKLFIPGGCGYLGAVLVPMLLADGHVITVYDTQWFGKGHLPENDNLRVVKGDVRNLDYYRKAVEDQDCVIYLASLSNNRMYSIDYKLTHEVNFECFPAVFANSKVDRFIYASSVAVEDPTSDYAKDKLACEEVLKGSNAVIVRAASVCGYSPHQRLDLTVNRMVHDAVRKKEITIEGGSQTRTHIHILDLCNAYRAILKAENISGQTFNFVGETQSIFQTAQDVREVFMKSGEWVARKRVPRVDDRSYSALNTQSPMLGFTPQKSVKDAVHDLKLRFGAGYWKDSSTNPIYQNIMESDEVKTSSRSG